MAKDESALLTPPEWQERFLIKRIGEEDIEITLRQRNAILTSLNRGDNFVQIGKYTLMLNAVKSIDPYWEPNNIPPRPKYEPAFDGEKQFNKNEERALLWDSLFGPKKLEQKHE